MNSGVTSLSTRRARPWMNRKLLFPSQRPRNFTVVTSSLYCIMTLKIVKAGLEKREKINIFERGAH